jgi:putative transposase
MKKRFTEEQIVRILHEAEGGMSTRDVCRKHGIAEQTFYRWKTKYGGMEVSEAKRLKALERENSELKKIVADLTLDNRMLRDVNTKKF